MVFEAQEEKAHQEYVAQQKAEEDRVRRRVEQSTSGSSDSDDDTPWISGSKSGGFSVSEKRSSGGRPSGSVSVKGDGTEGEATFNGDGSYSGSYRRRDFPARAR